MVTDTGATNNVSLLSSPRAYQAGASSPAVQALAELRRARRRAIASGPATGSRSYSGEDWTVEGLATSDVAATTIAAAVAHASHVLRTNRKAVLHHSSDTDQEDHGETRNDRWDEDSVQGIANRLARMLRTGQWARRHSAVATSPRTPVSGVKGGPLVDVRSRSAPSVRCGSRSPGPQDRARSVSVLRRSLDPTGQQGSSHSGWARRFDEIEGVVGNVTSEHNHIAVGAGEPDQLPLMGISVGGPNRGGLAGGQSSLCAPSSFHNTTSLSSSSSSSSSSSAAAAAAAAAAAISSPTMCNGKVDGRTWSAINAAVKSGYPLGVRNEIERSRRLLQRLQMVNGGLQQRRRGGFKGGSPEGRAIWGETWVWARLAAIAMSRDAV
ncbi:hypothetical protein Vafri_1069 [Volvox africanus]|nr:hypothetical protein Vafri_1069 [Volvox africanus]